MGMFDWLIVGGLLLVLVGVAVFSQRYVRSVADFLAANRCAGRYLITVCSGMAALCATTIIASFEGVYIGGLTNTWWNLGYGLIVSIMLISGWIIYRFRQTRALTLAQFLEIRYSRKFRIFAGIICWIAGIVNFGIFPAVCARFFMSAFQIPPDAMLYGVSVYALFLIILIAIPAVFALFGGQVTVMVTDFVQGIFCNLMMIVLVVASLLIIGFQSVDKTLLTGISRENQSLVMAKAEQIRAGTPVDEIGIDKKNPKAAVLTDALRFSVAQGGGTPEEITAAAAEYYRENDSMIHPMKIKKKQDLNIWFYLMSFWLVFYGGRIWQGSQGYNAAALTPHEARMGNVLSPLRIMIQTAFCVVLPICALAFFNSDAVPAPVSDYLAKLNNPHLQRQMSTPMAMMAFLPAGLKGCFIALMLAALISTYDSYLHSWGSIFIQDVFMPFYKKPLQQKSHLFLLRLSILFVGVFIFVFSLFFRQTEYIVMFWNITGAIFTGGAGAAVIGGLYWKRGTTGAAWLAMITGSALSVGSIILRQIHAAHPFTNPVLEFISSKNGMILAFWSGLIAFAVYIAVSLLNRKNPFNMDKMLHRGAYAVKEDEHIASALPVRGFKALIGVTDEFTKTDKIIYYCCTGWMLFQTVVFLIGTVYMTVAPVSDRAWLIYWKIHIGIFLTVGFIVTIWFTIGGSMDVVRMYKRLATIQRNEADDGTVTEKES